MVYPPQSLLCSRFAVCGGAAPSHPAPPWSYLCNSISVLQRALIDLFRRSTKWLAKSLSVSFFSFSSPRSFLQPTRACRWCTVLFIILSLVFSACRSFVPHFSSPLLSLSLQPLAQTPLTKLCYTVIKSTFLFKWIHTQHNNLSWTWSELNEVHRIVRHSRPTLLCTYTVMIQEAMLQKWFANSLLYTKIDAEECLVLSGKVVRPHLFWVTKLTAESKLEATHITWCETCYQYQKPT